jgi:hypothetical protein
VAALNSAFEHFLNLSTRSPEYISLFMDDKLRKGLKVGGFEGVCTEVVVGFGEKGTSVSSCSWMTSCARGAR